MYSLAFYLRNEPILLHTTSQISRYIEVSVLGTRDLLLFCAAVMTAVNLLFFDSIFSLRFYIMHRTRDRFGLDSIFSIYDFVIFHYETYDARQSGD